MEEVVVQHHAFLNSTVDETKVLIFTPGRITLENYRVHSE
jgi:hypothetical protein